MEQLKTLPEYLKATNADGTAVLEATASWCPQCKAIAPFVEELRKKYPDAKFYTYDTDTALDIAQELGARQMPTVSSSCPFGFALERFCERGKWDAAGPGRMGLVYGSSLFRDRACVDWLRLVVLTRSYSSMCSRMEIWAIR